jgi:hypothetical protein
MSAIYYMFGVFVISVFWSAIFSLTRSGAMREINLRGVSKVSCRTLKIADGTATLGDKVSIIITTILGSLVCTPFIIVSILVGGILYFIVEVIIR